MERIVFATTHCYLRDQRGAMFPSLTLLSTIGLYISTYFTLVSYGKIRADSRFVPWFCRMDEGSCALIIHHRDASVFGVPNSLLGIGYYGTLLAAGLSGGEVLSMHVLQVIAWLCVVLGVYLVYSLVLKVKVLCPLCLISHSINLVIAILLTL